MAKNSKSTSIDLFGELVKKKVENSNTDTIQKKENKQSIIKREEHQIEEESPDKISSLPLPELDEKNEVQAGIKPQFVSKEINKTNAPVKEDKKSYFQLSEYDLETLKSFTLVMDSDIYERFITESTINNIKRYNLVNSIIDSEKRWESDNPDFPSKEFIKESIKNIKNKPVEGRQRLTINLTTENSEFLKQRACQCGMKLYSFIEYMFDCFLD